VEIKRAGSQPSAKGPAENFTGAVRFLMPTDFHANENFVRVTL
jgi:hypothetical protein